jgi:hypothetical protein
LRVLTDIENGQVKGPYPVALQRKSKTRISSCNICFVRIAIVNDGRVTAQDAKAYADILRPQTAAGMMIYYVRWEMDKTFTQSDLDRSDLQKSIADFFDEKTDIEVGPGRILNVLYATDQDDKAHLVSQRDKPLDIPSITDFELEVVIPKFAAQNLGRFRITIDSWKDIRITRVTFETRLMEAIHTLLGRLKPRSVVHLLLRS